MHSAIFKLTMGVLVGVCLLWLIGYIRAISPYIAESFHDHDLTFLTYPFIQAYRVADSAVKLSPLYIDFFSVGNGPTGVEYTEWDFSCWIVSIAAFFGLLGGILGLLYSTAREHGHD